MNKSSHNLLIHKRAQTHIHWIHQLCACHCGQKKQENPPQMYVFVCKYTNCFFFSLSKFGFFYITLAQLLLFWMLTMFPNIFFQFFAHFLIFSYFSCCWFAASGAIIRYNVFFSALCRLFYSNSYSISCICGFFFEQIRRKLAHMRRMTMKLPLHNIFFLQRKYRREKKANSNVYKIALTLWFGDFSCIWYVYACFLLCDV